MISFSKTNFVIPLLLIFCGAGCDNKYMQSTANSAPPPNSAAEHLAFQKQVQFCLADVPPTKKIKDWVEIKPIGDDADPISGLLYLFAALKRHPQATGIKVNWGWQIFGHPFYCAAIYNRKTKKLRYYEDSGDEESYTNNLYLFSNVVPQMFYNAYVNHRGFIDLPKEGCKLVSFTKKMNTYKNPP